MTTIPPTKPAKSNEWYTPSQYIEAARSVMGSIDLDPASCALANETVKATRYFTVDDDGLSQAWRGNVWCNPPFNKVNGKSGIAQWTHKLTNAYRSGDIDQAVIITAGQTSSKWFKDMWQFPVCFTDHHVRFYCPQLGRHCGQRDCTIFAYLGPNETQFVNAFSEFGTVARRVTPTA